MKEKLLIKLFLFIPFIAFSQDYSGFISDNYSGLHSILDNPATAVSSPYLSDINLLSANAFVSNDYTGINLGAIINNDTNNFYDNSGDNISSKLEGNNFNLNASLLGPSFLVNLGYEHSLALTSRVRSLVNINSLDGAFFENYSTGFSNTEDYTFTQDKPNFISNSFMEIGLTYATELRKTKNTTLKSGISLKYLKGLGIMFAEVDNLKVDYHDADETMDTSGGLLYGVSDNFNKEVYILTPGSKGFGFDIGFVYEWKPNFDPKSKEVAKNYKNYKYKIGISLTDFGSITYPSSLNKKYNLDRTGIDTNTIDGDADLETTLDNLYSPTETREDIKVKLPTAAHISIDWNTNNKIYLNLHTDISIKGSSAKMTNRIVSTAILTPRYESKWFSAFSPISFNEHMNFKWGLGFRAGPVFVGSGSLLSNLFEKNSKGADIYFGLKIPLYRYEKPVETIKTKKRIDTDRDGTFDDEDKCLTVAGPKENNGCPWQDSDNDGVLDDVDKCINVVGDKNNEGCPWNDNDGDGIPNNKDHCPNLSGPNENDGCPWSDSDKDGILDSKDKCPYKAGPSENDGCPWSDTDKDGILDLKDKCPNIAGLVELDGCPKPKIEKEVIDQLNKYARTILFNTGKATFKKEAYVTLNAIYNIMVQYENAEFIIEGHTDNQGTPKDNQILSELRANAVMDFLMVRGVLAKRLSAVGYGETQPISSNDTERGREANRRVIIKVK
jgi:outer membrane protein OmpA-like peptidoglycan-associated protein